MSLLKGKVSVSEDNTSEHGFKVVLQRTVSAQCTYYLLILEYDSEVLHLNESHPLLSV